MSNNELKEGIFKSFKEAGEINDHPLLDEFSNIGRIVEVYPSLKEYEETLYEYIYDLYIFENSEGIRVMLNHTSNNFAKFICEGTEEVVTEFLRNLY